MTAPMQRLTFRDSERRIALAMGQAYISELTQMCGAPVPSGLLICSTVRDIRHALPVASNGLRRAVEAVHRKASSS